MLNLPYNITTNISFIKNIRNKFLKQMSKIGKNIRKIRITKGLSQTAFANLFNLTRASIGAYEEGRAEPKTDTTLQIAKYFSIPIEALLTEELTVNRLTNFNLKSVFSDNIVVKEKPLTYISKENWQSFLHGQLTLNDFTQNYPDTFLTGEMAIEIHDQISNEIVSGTIITCSETNVITPNNLYLHIFEGNSTIGSKSDINYSFKPNERLFIIHQKIENVQSSSNSDIERRLTQVENQLNQILKAWKNE